MGRAVTVTTATRVVVIKGPFAFKVVVLKVANSVTPGRAPFMTCIAVPGVADVLTVIRVGKYVLGFTMGGPTVLIGGMRDAVRTDGTVAALTPINAPMGSGV